MPSSMRRRGVATRLGGGVWQLGWEGGVWQLGWEGGVWQLGWEEGCGNSAGRRAVATRLVGWVWQLGWEDSVSPCVSVCKGQGGCVLCCECRVDGVLWRCVTDVLTVQVTGAHRVPGDE